MAKKKAVKKKATRPTTAKRKASPKKAEMLTLSGIAVSMANDYLKQRKSDMTEAGKGIDWDGGLEDLWRALICNYWIYGEEDLKAFLKQEVAAIKAIYDGQMNKTTGLRVLR